jgi:hypothetical protein
MPEQCDGVDDGACPGECRPECACAVAPDCGNDMRELPEECDGTDAAACPGSCRPDCACACDVVTAAGNIVKLDAFKGRLTAALRPALADYEREFVGVQIEDGDGVIARSNIGFIPPKGRSGRRWQFVSRQDGVFSVKLSRSASGQFRLGVKAKNWFSAANADETAATTFLRLKIGPRCFVFPVTDKRG